MFRENDKIGPYILRKKLGRGAFGVVWLAEKYTMAGSFEFALKLAAREDIDLKVLQEEVITWKSASGHPNVLPLIEADIHEDDYVIVSEYAPDGSLEKWLEDNGGRAPSIDAAIEMIIGILGGLEHLHSRQIIHRDLKPANILLQGNTPRLADFGLARVLKSTQSNTITGTVPYMSPDALKGARTVQTDVWSVGVIFYQLLAGQMPYPQKEQVNLMYAILNDEPPPLSDSVPQALREIIEHALKKNPDERYQSAKEMREALRVAERTKPEPVIERRKTTPILQTKVEERKTGKLAQHEDENKTLKIPPQQQTLLTSQINDEKTVTQKPQSFLDTTPTLEAKPLQSSPNNAKTKKNKDVWLAIGGVGVISVVVVLAIVIALIAFSPFPKPDNNTNTTLNKNTNTAQTTPSPKTQTTERGFIEDLNGVPLEMVKIPSGSFTMGSPDNEKDRDSNEGPQHRVTIGYDFYMGKFEVTHRQWQAVTGSYQSYFNGCNECPVGGVSWNKAQEFIKKLNAINDGYTYRLPSEAEWEYACRAGTTTAFSFGDSLSSIQANFDGNYPYGNAQSGQNLRTATKVGSYQPNVFGLYDMNGNVWEWCEDVYQDSYDNLPADGSANLSKGDLGSRILRGGSWAIEGHYLRSSKRGRGTPDESFANFGFRLVAFVRR